jgi:eukaryotic-like serine/threonine-protein kinase
MRIRPLYEFDVDQRIKIVKRHLAERWHNADVSGPTEGAYGEVYSINMPPNHHPGRLAAKCPKMKRFGSVERAREGIEQILHELEKTHNIFMIPWINRISEVQFIHGWPFLISIYRDGTLDDLIANPLNWSIQDRVSSLIQIVRALRMAKTHGIETHQDLKPGNVFIDDLARKGLPRDSDGMHFHMFVADFGLADAFRDFGRNNGSRPYMAPEQFSPDPPESGGLDLVDLFAVGVIAHECFADGQHPMGVGTIDVWPWQQGIEPKWNRKSIWRKWAERGDKCLPVTSKVLPNGVGELILSSLAPDPSKRPSFEAFENGLRDALKRFDSKTYAGLRMQVDHAESSQSTGAEWPHMDQRLADLRKFYSEN